MKKSSDLKFSYNLETNTADIGNNLVARHLTIKFSSD